MGTLNYDHFTQLAPEIMGQHSQNSWELAYIIQGNGTKTVSGAAAKFHAGEAMLIPPKMLYKWRFDSGNDFSDGIVEMIMVTFPSNMLHRLVRVFPEYAPLSKWYDSLARAVVFPRGDTDGIAIPLRQMEFQPPFERISTLLNLLAYIYKSQGRTNIGGFMVGDDAASKVARIETWLKANHEGKVSIGELSQYMCMNKSSMCTLFKQRTGKTIFQYLTSFRIATAMRLLETEPVSVAQCCYRSGFNDVPHFNRVFKRLTGMTPNEYREKATNFTD